MKKPMAKRSVAAYGEEVVEQSTQNGRTCHLETYQELEKTENELIQTLKTSGTRAILT